jgi:hypothetical protein
VTTDVSRCLPWVPFEAKRGGHGWDYIPTL